MTAEDEARALKEKGNKAFKEHDWPTAIECYTKAIELNDKDVSFYTNRSQVRYHGLRNIYLLLRLRAIDTENRLASFLVKLNLSLHRPI